MDEVLAVDYGPWESQEDPNVMLENGVGLAIIKSSSGDMVDHKFREHAEKLEAAKMPWAIYHWAEPPVAPEKQAEAIEKALATVSKNYGPIFVAVDVEQDWSDWAQWWEYIRGKRKEYNRYKGQRLSSAYINITNVLRNHFPNVIVYSRATFIDDAAPDFGRYICKNGIPLWLAHYNSQPAKRTRTSWDEIKAYWLPTRGPLLPQTCPSAKVVGHQFSGDKFMLPGFGNAVDLNVFDREWLESIGYQAVAPFISDTASPAKPDETKEAAEPSSMQAIVVTNSLNIRSEPSTRGEILGHYKAGDVVSFYDCVWNQKSVWLLTERGWIAAQWRGLVLARKKDSGGAYEH